MTPWNKIARENENPLHRSMTPYVHWWEEHDQTDRNRTHQFAGVGNLQLTATLFGAFNGTSLSISTISLNTSGLKLFAAPARPEDGFVVKSELSGPGLQVLPNYALKKDSSKKDGVPGNLKNRMGTVPKDTVIVGLIDDGIALGHPRFRQPTDSGELGTRFLSAWLQGGVYNDGPQPFGREIFAVDIESVFNSKTEEAFNGAMEPTPDGEIGLSIGAKRLMGAATHGTHVLDIATGMDPLSANTEEMAKQRIIAVNLPSRTAIGMAGTFLEFFVIKAIQRIVDLSDALWLELYGKDEPNGGFPIVINLSYGQQAGTKTGDSLIEQKFKRLEVERQRDRPDCGPLRLVMPIGNDNLSRCNARWQLRQQSKPLPIGWRILPQDQSSNFVEVWADLKSSEPRTTGGSFPLKIRLTEPQKKPGPWIEGEDDHYFDHPGGFLRVYSEISTVNDVSSSGIQNSLDAAAKGEALPAPISRRLRYVIAMRPTLDHERPTNVGLAGRWTIELDWSDDADFKDKDDLKFGRNLYVNVQVDQEPSPSSDINHRSYFDGERYHTHAPSGRPLDTFAYLESEHDLAGDKDNMEPANNFWAIQRKGTQNSLSNQLDILTIAGHRAFDGRPADFSATTYPSEKLPDEVVHQILGNPVASFPVDISPTQTGIRAAGPAGGSSTTLRGTSFAAPQATRWAVKSLRAALSNGQSDLSKVATPNHLRTIAAECDQREVDAGRYWANANPAKVGFGRMRIGEFMGSVTSAKVTTSDS